MTLGKVLLSFICLYLLSHRDKKKSVLPSAAKVLMLKVGKQTEIGLGGALCRLQRLLLFRGALSHS